LSAALRCLDTPLPRTNEACECGVNGFNKAEQVKPETAENMRLALNELEIKACGLLLLRWALISPLDRH